MEKSLADLLSDAFSDSSVPSFAKDEDLDFEHLDFKDDETILSHGNNIVEEEDISPLLEAASTSVYHNEHRIFDAKNNSLDGYSSSEEECEENKSQINEILGDFMHKIHYSTQDNIDINPSILNQEDIAEKVDIAPILETPSWDLHKDDEQKLQAKNIQDVARREPSSEEESEGDEVKIKQIAGDFFETLWRGNDNEQVFATGGDLDHKDRNQNSNQEESEIEKQSYFGSIQRNEGDLIKRDTSEEDEKESTKTMFFQVEYTLEYPEISYDGSEELINEVDKMEEFSGDEHQEAGETFADYPSDFSSCEYVNDARIVRESDFKPQLDLETTSQKGVEEVKTERFLNHEPRIDCISKNKTDGDKELCHKHEEGFLEMTDQDVCLKLPKDKDNDAHSTWCNSEEETKISNADNTGINASCMPVSNQQTTFQYMNYEECLMGEEKEFPKKEVSSSHGSVDDGFFFNEEIVSRVTEKMEDHEEEEKWREQERIQAFYRFYDDQDKDSSREERQTKVQFCTETLSQVICYDTESERESLSTSSDEGEKDLEEDPEQTSEMGTCSSMGPDEVDWSQEPQEDQDQTQNRPLNLTEITTPKSVSKPIGKRNQKCLSALKLILSIFLAIVMGLIMFWWWVTGAEGWSAFVL